MRYAARGTARTGAPFEGNASLRWLRLRSGAYPSITTAAYLLFDLRTDWYEDLSKSLDEIQIMDAESDER